MIRRRIKPSHFSHNEPDRHAMKKSKNKLYVADNLDIMRGMNSETVDLIYLDPPFNSKRIYAAPIGSPAEKKAAAKGKVASFDDIWTWNDDVDIRLESFLDSHADLFVYIQSVGKIHGLPMKAYLTFMAQRIIEMHRLLKSTGSLYLHCDPTANSYLRVLLDYVFGKNNFRNEIVWRIGWVSGYKTQKKGWVRNHDTILYYLKSKDAASLFNKEYIPYPEDYVRRDGKKPTGRGIPMEDTWNCNSSDILDSIAIKSFSTEKTGYPTQKPLLLMERIIKASSSEGDMVMDPFCGCATTCVAAQNLHRNWIGIDVSEVAVDLVTDRLSREQDGQLLLFTDFVPLKTPPARTDQPKLTWNKKRIREHLYGKQKGYCNGCNKHFEIIHLEIDHIFPESRGGAWVLENLQLLCGNCNRIKGDRPMEYLQAAIKARGERIQFF